jgi:hypothetical protein
MTFQHHVRVWRGDAHPSTFVGDFGVVGGQVARDGFGDVAEGIELLRGEQVSEAVTDCKQMVGSCHFDGSTTGLGKDDVETTPVTGTALAQPSLGPPSGRSGGRTGCVATRAISSRSEP